MWCRHAVEELRAGRQATVRPRGNSMLPLIVSGARVVLAPLGDRQLQAGDIVLAKVKGNWYLHKVSAVSGQRVQIANNRGHVNGWTSRAQVVGRAVEIDNG